MGLMKLSVAIVIILTSLACIILNMTFSVVPGRITLYTKGTVDQSGSWGQRVEFKSV